MQKIGPHSYAETGFRGCNPGFVVTKEGVVMIDTPQLPADAVAWRREIERHGEVLFIINTEPHGDHFTGNHFFGGRVVGHEGTREAVLAASVDQLRERLEQMHPESMPLLEGFAYRAPSVTLSERLSLYVGDHSFHLVNLPGHTPYQIAVHIPEERVVFTSDNVFCRVQAWLHQALPFEWMDSLSRLEEFDADVLVPGHGVLCDPGYIPEMRGFIQDWVDAVKGAIDRGMSLDEARESISFLDRYPMEKGSEPMARQVQFWNVERLYSVLKP